MTIFTKVGADIASPVDAAGAPRSPSLADFQVWMTEMELAAVARAVGAVTFGTKAEADAALTYAAWTTAWIIADATVANNGWYTKSGASGAGSWVRKGDLPYSYIKATNAGAGTANAIVATTATPIPAADGGALIALPIVADTTASPVTVAFNGGTALTIKSNSGNDIAAGGLTAGMIVAGYVAGGGTTFRLLSDQDVSAAVAAAEAAQAAAEDAQAASEAAAASVNYRAVADRAALKDLDTTLHTAAYLTEAGREGQFIWRTGEYTTKQTDDPGEGMVLKADGVLIAEGAWERLLDGAFVAPEKFGADGTAAGDTLSLQRAIDYAAEHDLAVRLLRRHYLINAAIKLRDKTMLVGSGWSAEYNGSVQYSSGSVLRLQPGSDCNVLEQDSPTYRESFYLADFAVYGDGANQTSDPTQDATTGIWQKNRAGIFVQAAYNSKMVNVRAENTRGSGFDIWGDASSITNLFLESCSAYNNRVYNIWMGGNATDVRLSGQGDFGFGRCGGLRLGTSCSSVGQTFWTSQCQDPEDPDTHSSGTGAVGSDQGGIIMAGNNGKVQGGRSEGHAGHGIRVPNGVNAPEIADVTVYAVSSTASTDNLFDGISLGDSVVRPIVVGNRVKSSLGGTTRIRRALSIGSSVTNPTVRGNSFRSIAYGGAFTNGEAVVTGVPLLDSDTDWSWIGSQVSASQSVAQSSITTATTIVYDSEGGDAEGEYNPATGEFTPDQTGPYTIDASLLYSPGAATQLSTLALYSASETVRLDSHIAGATGSNLLLRGSVTINLTAGTAYSVKASFSSSSNTVAGAPFSYLRIRKDA